MDFRRTIATINDMVADGVIERYAIGGAVGATFYLEPVTTLDLDVFTTIPTGPGGLLDLSPIVGYLMERGAIQDGEYVVIHGTPVQFLPPPTPLVEEALDSATQFDIEGVPARVFTAEHLAAIALQTGRPKDKARLVQFLEESAFNKPRFLEIVDRHGLAASWNRFQSLMEDS